MYRMEDPAIIIPDESSVETLVEVNLSEEMNNSASNFEKENYNSIREKTSLPQYRKYHLTSDQKEAVLSKFKDESGELFRVPNPLASRIGPYWGACEALIQLGVDEWHRLNVVFEKMQEVMSACSKSKKVSGKTVKTNAWDIFENKKSRSNANNPRSCLGRVENNFRVLQRLPREGKVERHPYGLKLAQFGHCIDIEYRKEEHVDVYVPFYRYNTTFSPDDTGASVLPLYKNLGAKRGRRKKKSSDAPESNTDDSK